MILRELSRETDWPILHGIWVEKTQTCIAPVMLPPTGLVAVREDGVLLCGGFLVKSDTAMASLTCLIGNPSVLKDERDEGLDAVILALVEIAMQAGFSQVGVATTVQAVRDRLDRLGFVKIADGMTCYGGYS